MSTDKINLNLARKWRSKDFDQIIGQDLSVRMLKNSLYLNQLFPVYLFSGQRGCGKTSTARVFASAINCAHLSKFQKNPKKYSLPCSSCSSCKAMLSGNHPDFIEIDAASHTGVDNVRQIIEASSFMPLMGKKRVYLIDEAHMLSKAAFNAFLKILEEPPSSVIFILATTNPKKIIETVRSRCFQLLFNPVSYKPLLGHLKNICDTEAIAYDEKGLGIIVRESQGSVRDSINILEQVRFSSSSVTKDNVQQVLGHVDEERLVKLFECLLTKGPKDVLAFLKEIKFELFSAEYIWNKIIDLLRAAIWIKNGVEPAWRFEHVETIKNMVKQCSLARLTCLMQQLYENEHIFLRTTAKHSLLEMILIQMCRKNDIPNKSGASSVPQQVMPAEQDDEEFEEAEEEEVALRRAPDFDKASSGRQDDEERCEKTEQSDWGKFLSLLNSLNDPLLTSIFKNGTFVAFDAQSGKLELQFLKQFSFFNDSLKETEKQWLPFLQKVFGANVVFSPQFTGVGEIKVAKKRSSENVVSNSVSTEKKVTSSFSANRSYPRSSGNYGKNTKKDILNTGKIVDVSDAATWKKANTLLRYFSGSVREMIES